MAFRKKTLAEDLLQQYHSLRCAACPLDKADLKNPKMLASGTDEPFIYFIGEAPGREEDERNEFFYGDSGKLLKKTFIKDELRFLVKDKQDVRKISWLEINDLANKKGRFNNTLRCRPPSNRDPTMEETECCRPFLEEDIIATKPKVVVGTGNVPLRWMLNIDAGITAVRGKKFPVRLGTHKFWFMPVFHPSYLVRQGVTYNGGVDGPESITWKNDIKAAWALEASDEEPFVEEPLDIDKGIVWVDGSDDRDCKLVIDFFKDIEELPAVALDLETTAIRPYGKDARILTVAIGTDTDTLAFPLHHVSAKWTSGQLWVIEDLFKQLIRGDKNPKQIKIAHNLGFELEWLGHKYGNNYFHNTTWACTMAQAYILDSRRGGLGLDLLCRQYFGLPLKGESDVDIKNIENSPLNTVLRYNALDTKYTFKLHFVQQKLITEQGLDEQYDHQVARILPLVYAENTGLPIDKAKVDYFDKKLTTELEEIEIAMRASPVVQRYVKFRDDEYNPRSTKQNQEIFRDELKCREGYVKGKYSTSAEVLARIKHPLARLLEDHRGVAKIHSTYVKSLTLSGKYHWPDGRIHPSFSSTAARTRRLSSSDPNGQNFPARKHREIRSQIVAPPGMVMVAIDYGQIEARIIGMASGDANLSDYIRRGYDIHGDWASRLSHSYPEVIGGEKFLDDKKKMKDFRTAVKNEFVFPLFYGAEDGTISHATGIPYKYVKPHIDDFWNMFPEVKKWQGKLHKFYKKHQYVETLTGFRCRAPLTPNQVINYPIQGSASDVVVDAMVRLSQIAHEEDLPALRPVLNIHDDLTYFIPKDDLDEYLEVIIPAMLFPNFEFVTLPLSVEVSVGDTWGTLTELGTFTSDEWQHS